MAKPALPPRDQTEYAEMARFRWGGHLGGWLLRALGATWGVDWEVPVSLRRLLDDEQPVIWTFWHQHILPLTYTHRRRGVVVLVSRSPDGEYISQILHRMGYGTVRGSSSKGGMRALLRMAQLGAGGQALSVTPDGPRGPRQLLQPGVLSIAARSGLPIVPLAAGLRGCWRLRSWDRFEIPRPFTRVRVYCGEPIAIENLGGAAIETTYATQVQAALDQVERAAAAFSRGAPGENDSREG